MRETESSLYKQSFDNVITQYDSMLQGIEHQKSMLDEYISQSEERGYIVSIKYYEELKKRERDSILKLEEERNDMQAALDNAIQSGTIAQYSEAWWEMKNSIDDVTLSIEEGHTALIEFDNAIRDINWGIFDLMQGRMSRVSKESDFLISLFETNKLYKESGQLTNEGLSTMGSHAVNYNVYMSQADKYAREISKLESEINNDPFNQTLIDRKHELIDLQQEMILNAESEKNAIVDMVREGIELELNSLNELIDTYNEALDAEKDLYEYQKNVSSQSRNIANIQKQLSAYQGDNSEETRLKVQELKSALNEAEQELRETEYDKYTSDQKELLDSLYSEYESILNARLDNVDLLVSDMIQTVNDNSSTINNTITSKADSLGYALMSVGEIWDTDFGVVSMYGAQTVDKLTSLESYLSTIASSASSILNSMEIQSKMNAVVGNKDGVIRGLASLDGYASGAKHIKSNKYAWTQENGREFIIRPSDGAILTPVATGDSILSNFATNNLWDLANNPHSFIQNSIKTNSSVIPVSTAGSVSYNQTLDKVVFNLPNVKNYEELLSSMQRDKNFENLILAMTVDRIAGKNLLGKGKSIR